MSYRRAKSSLVLTLSPSHPDLSHFETASHCMPVSDLLSALVGFWDDDSASACASARALTTSTFRPPTPSLDELNNNIHPTAMLLVTAKLSSPALPEELWVDILCHFSYFDLKRLKRTSQTFRHLLRLPVLARRLFRTRPTRVSARTIRRTEHITLHPLFDLVACPPELDYEDLELNDSDDVLSELKTSTEMATNPPLKKLSVVLVGTPFKPRPSICFSNGRGITVEDVYRRIVQLVNGFNNEALQFVVDCSLYNDKRDRMLMWECRARVSQEGRARLCVNLLIPPRAFKVCHSPKFSQHPLTMRLSS